MKLFRHSSGVILSFGFDMWKRRPDSRRIFWSDLLGSCWRPGEKLADFATVAFDVAPEFVLEGNDGVVVAYQPGLCIQLVPQSAGVSTWRVTVLRPEPEDRVREGFPPMYDFREDLTLFGANQHTAQT